MKTDKPSVSTLHELLELHRETGRLFWKHRELFWFAETDFPESRQAAWNSAFSGKEALAAVNSAGYRKGSVLGRQYLAHRVVFAMTHGKWPTACVDHENHDRLDNRPVNLREASRRDNNRNRTSRCGSTSRFLGVHWDRQRCKWFAKIKHTDGYKNLGRFADEVDAARAYNVAARKYHGVFANLNKNENGDAL